MTTRTFMPAVLLLALAACGDKAVAPAADVDAGGATGAPPATPSGQLTLAAGAPDEMIAGGHVTIGGTGFSPSAGENVVALDGVPLPVVSASASALVVALSTSQFACRPARAVTLSVSARGQAATRSVTLRSARPHALAPGAAVVLGEDVRCVELPTAAGRYLVSVLNTGRTVASVAPFELVGSTAGSSVAASTAMASAAATPPSPVWSADRSVAAGGATPDEQAARRREKLHHHVLETSRGLRARLGRPGRRPGMAPSMSASPSSSGETVLASAGPTSGLSFPGDTATLRVPDINGSNACSKYFSVRTRVVYSGARAVILEDLDAPLAGRMDATYRAVGEEFDSVMWPVLTTNFGNPLAMDAQLDRNGKILMLFSPVVNNKFSGIAGFVIGCDFYSRAQAPSSNEGEIFYATVPTTLSGSTTSSASPDGWRRTMRSTIIHEAKHITAYAERLSRGHGIEEAWLEEGTARHSEELYARARSGGAWKANAGYAAIACDVRPTVSSCADHPYVMYRHFTGLAGYLAANGTLSPLGKTSTNDYNYYASAWALVRWAADLAPGEAAFLQSLTRGPRLGVSNLEEATGRTWADMLADWTMSLALDDHAGFNPVRAQRIASWNLQDVFAGMHKDFPSSYPNPHPLAAHAATFGGFSVQNPVLRGGSGAVVDLAGSWAGPQVLELRLPGGGAPSATLRLAVTRVQ